MLSSLTNNASHRLLAVVCLCRAATRAIPASVRYRATKSASRNTTATQAAADRRQAVSPGAVLPLVWRQRNTPPVSCDSSAPGRGSQNRLPAGVHVSDSHHMANHACALLAMTRRSVRPQAHPRGSTATAQRRCRRPVDPQGLHRGTMLGGGSHGDREGAHSLRPGRSHAAQLASPSSCRHVQLFHETGNIWGGKACFAPHPVESWWYRSCWRLSYGRPPSLGTVSRTTT